MEDPDITGKFVVGSSVVSVHLKEVEMDGVTEYGIEAVSGDETWRVEKKQLLNEYRGISTGAEAILNRLIS